MTYGPKRGTGISKDGSLKFRRQAAMHTINENTEAFQVLNAPDLARLEQKARSAGYKWAQDQRSPMTLDQLSKFLGTKPVPESVWNAYTSSYSLHSERNAVA